MITTQRELSFDKIEAFSKILKVISHPVRLEIIKTLENNGVMNVNELLSELNKRSKIEQPTLSHHLNKMKDKGILKSTQDGKYIFYSIQNHTILKIFDCIEGCSAL